MHSAFRILISKIADTNSSLYPGTHLKKENVSPSPWDCQGCRKWTKGMDKFHNEDCFTINYRGDKLKSSAEETQQGYP